MPLIYTDDHEYLFAIDDYNDTRNGKPQWVVYDRNMNVLIDRHGYEATRGPAPDPQPQPAIPPNVPPQAPPPAVGVPSGLRVIRVTDQSDGDVVPRMYSYWPNAWIGDTGSVYVFAGHVDGTSRFFRVELATGQVHRFGPLVHYTGTTEGWYWDLEGYVYLIDGSALRRVNPFTGDDRVVVDISDSQPGCVLWQAHSSDDGLTHCATVKRVVNDGPYPAIGTIAVRRGRQAFYPAQGDLDESQITPDGQFLVIKESENNRIINIDTRDTRMIYDQDGAVGHSDCGPAMLVGEDNIHGACVRWDLLGPLVPERRKELFRTWGMGHISIRGGRCLLSNETSISLVDVDGAGVTPLIDHGMTGSGYDYQVKANLDPTGRVACYMSNQGGGRMDVFLLVL